MEATRKRSSEPDSAPPLRVLVVEDNDSDAMVAQAAVEKAVRGPFEVQRAATLANGLAIVKLSNVDLVLLDLNLPDSRGIETLKRMRVATSCPIIVVTVEDRPGLVEEALGNGAFEILHKGRLGPDAFVRLLRLAEDRRRAQGSLENAEHRFRSLTELSSDWYWEQDAEFRWTFFSPGFSQRSGATPEKLLGKRRWEEPHRVPLQGSWEEHRAMLEAHKAFRNFEFLRIDADGKRVFQSVNGEPFYDKAGNFAGYRGTSRDITERMLAEEALKRAHSRLELALAASRVCTWDYDLPSAEVVLSESWAEIIGAPPSETRTTFKALGELVHPDDFAALRQTLIDVIKGQRTGYAVEHRVRHRSGEWRWIISRGKVVERDARGRAVRMAGTNLDITERKLAEDRLRESEARFRGLTDLSSDWYWEQDEKLRFVRGSASVEKQGFSPASDYGKTRWELPVIGVSEEQWAEHRSVLESHQPFRDFEFQRVTERGDTVWLSVSGTPMFDQQERFKGYRGIGRNITERKRAEARLAHLAQFDSVTGLPNRNLLGERLEQAITQARRHGRGAGVLFVDLDHFKLVNDTLGHHAGDEMLAQVGKRLRECVRPDDTVGRLSGDEFAVVVADLARADDAALVAQKIIDGLAAPFELFGQETFITASIGVAAFPNDGDGAGALLKCADTAMYRVKESSRNAFRFFAADMNTRAASQLHLHTDLRHAVERREFQLHYQPKVDLASGAMIGMEALIRWQHPVRGMVSPMEFIPALENTGLIVPVGDWVVEEARTQLRNWTRAGLTPVPIAVNLSAKQFRRRDLDQVIRRLLAEHGISPQLLELEITESCLMDDPKDAVRQLHALRDSGLTISVDDFGTGYSSLSYLTRLPLSTLKIDRSFVNAAISDPSSAAIVKMVIDMAQSLRFKVVAEGIETNQHVDFLRRHGCEQGQGYHFGKPMTAEAIAPRLARQ